MRLVNGWARSVALAIALLLATLGGLTMFGIAGFVAGPIIAALFLVTWQMFADEYAPLDSSHPFGMGAPQTVVVTGDPDPRTDDDELASS